MRFNINRQSRVSPKLPKSPVIKTPMISGYKVQPKDPAVIRSQYVRPKKSLPKKIPIRKDISEEIIKRAKKISKKPKQGIPIPSEKARVIQKRQIRKAVVPNPDASRRGGHSKLYGKKIEQDKMYAQYNGRIQKLKDSGKDRILVMIACGPSIKEVPLEKIIGHKSIDFMVINQPYGYYEDRCQSEHRGIWPPKYWVMCDSSQQRRNSNAWNAYRGTVITSASVKQRHPNHVMIKNRSGKGFSTDLVKGYHIGRSTTYANMQAALYMNYDRIYIFGIDMNSVNGSLHHYGVNPDVTPENRKSRFSEEARHYEFAAQKLSEDKRKRFIFCSSYNPFPFVNKFNKLDHKIAPDKILEYLEQR